MYRSTMGLDVAISDGNTFQNCEAAWVGGGSHQIGFKDFWNGNPFVPTSGECVRMEGNNNTTKNCYVHDSFDGGVTVEFNVNGTYFKNMNMTGNVIEYCISGILVSDHNNDPKASATFGGITISDNYILYSGYGWSSNKHYNFTWGNEDYDGNAISFGDGPCVNDGIIVENNTFYIAKFALVNMGSFEKYKAHFSGNSYIQNKNGILDYLIGNNEYNLVKYLAISDDKNITICTNGIGDKTAKVLPLTE
jgi:hypothetical protein